MKKIIKVGKFEFIILVICQKHGPRLIDIINDLNQRYNKEFSRGYICNVMKKLRDAKLVTRDKEKYELTEKGDAYMELYDKL